MNTYLVRHTSKRARAPLRKRQFRRASEQSRVCGCTRGSPPGQNQVKRRASAQRNTITVPLLRAASSELSRASS